MIKMKGTTIICTPVRIFLSQEQKQLCPLDMYSQQNIKTYHFYFFLGNNVYKTNKLYRHVYGCIYMLVRRQLNFISKIYFEQNKQTKQGTHTVNLGSRILYTSTSSIIKWNKFENALSNTIPATEGSSAP